MNAPTIINAAHEVLLRAEDALSVTDVVRELNGTTKPNQSQIKAAERLLKELNGLGLIAPEFRTGGVAFYRLIVAPAAQVGDMSVADIAQPAECAAVSGDSEGGDTDITSRIISAISEAQPGEVSQDIMRAAKRLETSRERDELHQQLSIIAETVAPYLPDLSDISTARAVEMMDMLADAQAEHIREQDKTIAGLRERLDQQILQWQADTGRLTADLRAAMESRSQTINEATRLRAELAAERQAREALQEQAAGPVGVAGYIVRAAKRKPRTIMKADTAKSAAMGAIRAGAQRADVFALVPVGTARRGAEWGDA